MLVGFPPFKGDNRMKLFEDIIYSEANLKPVNLINNIVQFWASRSI